MRVWALLPFLKGLLAMKVTDRPFSSLLALLTSGTPFTFSRWGPHEWQAMFDQHARPAYLQKLGHDLRVLLRSRPPYTLSLEKKALGLNHFGRWLDKHDLGDLEWSSAGVFRAALLTRKFAHLVRAVSSLRRVVFIGPPSLERLCKRLPNSRLVVVPPRHAYLALNSVFRDAMGECEPLPPGSLVSVSAGRATPLLLGLLYPRLGRTCSLIDFGGAWESYLDSEGGDGLAPAKLSACS